MKDKVTIVFAGDSITDAGRNREVKTDLGKGFPNIAASLLMLDYPGKIVAYNSAYSGYRSSQILCRWECECLDYKPDFIVLLMGANDFLYELHSNNKNFDKKFETVTRLMFEDVKSDLPDAKVLVFSPYIFDGEYCESRYNELIEIAARKVKILKELCEEYGFKNINLQVEFEKYSSDHKIPLDYWTADGVHPTPAGHQLIARKVIETFNEFFRE